MAKVVQRWIVSFGLVGISCGVLGLGMSDAEVLKSKSNPSGAGGEREVLASIAAPSMEPTEHTRVPLTVETALRISTFTGVDLSPDGAWLAYQFADANTGGTVRLRLIEIASHETIDLAAPGIVTDRPAWSPDSQHLAFYSEASGKPMLWVWNRKTRQARMVPGAEFPEQVRARVRWFPDSRRMLIPLRAVDNHAPTKSDATEAREPSPAPREAKASVSVFQANFDSAKRSETEASVDTDVMRRLYPPCDLGIVDLQTDQIRIVAQQIVATLFQAPSPDARHVAYAAWVGRSQETQLDLYDLHLVELSSLKDRVIARNLHGAFGLGFSWSPDGRSIAHLEGRALHAGEGSRDQLFPADMWIIPIDGSAIAKFDRSGFPALSGLDRAIWDDRSQKVYVLTVARGLWDIDLATGRGHAVTELGTREVAALIHPNEQDALSSGDANPLLLMLEDHASATGGLYAFDPRTRILSTLTAGEQSLGSADVTRAMGTVSFITSRQQSPSDLWLWRAHSDAPVRVADLNPLLAGTSLAEAQRLTWQRADGRPLAGTLLIPSDYQPGERRPLFVWVYGGRMGSEEMNRFGFGNVSSWSAVDNMQILASRGYVVLAPDIPQRVGTPMEDIVAAVLPGVDAAIAQGFADPNRLAIGGHSYGSYSALALITNTSRFKAAIISGVVDPNLVSNYLQMKTNGNTSYYWAESGQGLIGGTPWQYPERYRENSPIFLFDKIETPVLIGQGALDNTTQISGANAVFAALRRLGKPVEYRVYDGERHVIRQPANIADFWDRRLSFLAETLDIQTDQLGCVALSAGRVRSRTTTTLARELRDDPQRSLHSSRPAP